MRLFLDTSILLAASGSAGGASRFFITEAAAHGWIADQLHMGMGGSVSKYVSLMGVGAGAGAGKTEIQRIEA